MKKAILIYSSRTGITEKYGREIGRFLNSKGVETIIRSVDSDHLKKDFDTDIVLLGCWTAGFMLLFQHPDKKWKKFAKQIPDLENKKVALFTTYKIAAGSMFRRMQKHLSGKSANISLTLKSKDGSISNADKKALTDFLANKE